MNNLEQLFPENLRFIYHTIFFPTTWMEWVTQQQGYSFILCLIFLVLPILLFIVASISTALSLIFFLFRSNRTRFMASIMISWIDGGKSVLLYWAGIFKFLFFTIGWIGAAFRIFVYGVFQTVKDVIFSPLTFLLHLIKGYARPGIPWIAVLMTLLWICVEGAAFTFFSMHLVLDTVSAMTELQINPVYLAPIMFVCISLVVGGSFALMHVLVDAIKQRRIFNIIKLLLIEGVVMGLEVLFFYKEFVHSALSQLSQMTEESGFVPGFITILVLAAAAWSGIRAVTWFLFARYGTPTLLLIISREGIDESMGKKGKPLIGAPLSWIKEITATLQGELDWFSKKGEEITAAFILPPIQVIAAMINFIMVLLTGKFLFNLPIKSMSDLKDTKQMLGQVADE